MLRQPGSSRSVQVCPGSRVEGILSDGSNIDLLVDNSTGRILQVHPNMHVLFVQSMPNGPWQSLGLLNEALEAVVQRILAVGPSWKGPDAMKQRIEFFLTLVGHQDSRIQELAYLELGRAPYPMVRQLGRVVPREAIEPMLQERRYYEWRGLAILLLAQSDSESDRQYIRESFQAAERFAVVTHLAAWAAAAMEVDADSTMYQSKRNILVRLIELPRSSRQYLVPCRCMDHAKSSHLETASLRAMDDCWKDCRSLLRRSAEDMHAWKRNELSDALAHVLDQRREAIDQAGTIKVQRYLRSVKIAASTGRPHD